jgi:predicted dehydrogenase
VLCEKPLEITLEKIDAMIEACRDAHVKLGCTYQYRTADHNQAAYQVIHYGKLGRIYIANAFLKWWRGQEYYESSNWRGTWDLDGGGPFIQQAAHTVDILIWVMGRPRKVTAWTRTVAHDIEVEDMGHAIVEYQNGAQGVIEASTVVKPGYPTRIEIHGEKGSIILGESEVIAWDVEGVEPPTLERDNIVTGATDPTGIGTKNHERIIRDFIQAIRKDRDPMVNPASARRTSELITAIYKSSHEGRTVELSEGRD